MTDLEKSVLKEHLKLLHRVLLEQARSIQAVEDFLLAHPETPSAFRKLPDAMTVEEIESTLQTSFLNLEKTLKGQF